MLNKIILCVVVLALFIFAGVAGYYGPDWIKAKEDAQERAAFVPGAVPKSQYDDFAAQFALVEKATEPKYLPDDGLADTKGNPVRLKNFTGKPTLVNLWATWCAPCVTELPSLQKFKAHYDGKINVVAISVEQEKTPAAIALFLEKRELSGLGGYLDRNGIYMKNLGLRGIPTSFLLGSNGQILYRFEGDAIWDSPQTQEFFDVFLLQNR